MRSNTELKKGPKKVQLKTGKMIRSLGVSLFIFLNLTFAMTYANAQTVTAEVQPKVVRPGQGFILSVTVSSDASVSAEQPELPDLSNFQLRNQYSSSETRSVFNNGKFQVSRAQRFNYELMAMQPGQFTIGSIGVVVNGQLLKTQPVSIQVAQGAPPPQGQGQGFGGGFSDDEDQEQLDQVDQMDDMFQQLLRRRLDRLQRGGPGGGNGNGGGIVSPADLKDAFYVEVEVDKTKVYVGEQVTVSWYLVTRAQIADIDTLKYPAVEGFWREDIELATRLNFRPEVVNGVTYQKALLASFALFPIKAGMSKIDEYTARCNVVAIGNFGATNQQTVVKSSQAVPITVLPLPAEGKPDSFTGAVGEFQVSARVDSQNIVTNSPFEYKIRFEGRGNTKNIDAPKLALPEGLEVYDTKSETKYFIDGRSFKEFNYVIVARKVGPAVIPAVTSSFFNQNTKKYYTQSTQPLSLNIAQGENAGPMDSKPMATAEVAKESKPTLPPLALEMSDSSSLSTNTKLATWSVILFLGLAFIVYRGFKEFGSSEKRESLAKIVKSKFKHIDSLAAKGEMRNAAVEATNLVYLILGELSGLGGANRQMSVLLEKSPPSYRREVGESLEKTMRKLEVLAFAPTEMSGTNKVEQKNLLAEVEKMLRKSLEYNFESDEQEDRD